MINGQKWDASRESVSGPVASGPPIQRREERRKAQGRSPSGILANVNTRFESVQVSVPIALYMRPLNDISIRNISMINVYLLYLNQ
jgi:hypothetical protein